MPTDSRRGSSSGSVVTWRQGDTVAPPTVLRTLDTPVGGSTSTGAELPGQGDPSGRRDASPVVLLTSRVTHTPKTTTRHHAATGRPVRAAAFTLPVGGCAHPRHPR